jgi:hypothetical protein
MFGDLLKTNARDQDNSSSASPRGRSGLKTLQVGKPAFDCGGERSGLQTLTAMESVSFVHADEKLTAFLELQRAIHQFAVNLLS